MKRKDLDLDQIMQENGIGIDGDGGPAMSDGGVRQRDRWMRHSRPRVLHGPGQRSQRDVGSLSITKLIDRDKL